MRTLLHPFLPNGPGGDPVVWIDVLDEGTSLLLDMGDLRAIDHRKLLRVERAIVTHTHMDHFIGFDQLLRVSLHRERPLTLTGPPGFINHVAHRIAGYTWNLIGAYPVKLIVEEVDDTTIRSAVFAGEGGLVREPLPDRSFEGTVWAHRAFTLHVDRFDHGIPVLGVAIRETERLSVDKDALTRMGLAAGPWLADLKNAVRRCEPDKTDVTAATIDRRECRHTIGELRERILTRTPGQRMAYLTDLRFSPANRERALRLAEGVDLMISEATFLHADAALASERGHLTAHQAGALARDAGARRLALFHFSPRYKGQENQLIDEAAQAFGGPVIELPTGAWDAGDQHC